VKTFIAKHNETGLDTSLSYLDESFKEQWLTDNPDYHEAVHALQEDGSLYSHYLQVPDAEGVYQPDLEGMQEELIDTNKTLAKGTRDCFCNCNLEVLGFMWQVDTPSRDFMRDGINTYKCMVALELLKPPEERVEVPNLTNWILADNTTRWTTVEELEEVLCQYSLRVQSTFDSYNVWRAGDCLEEYTI